MCLARNAHGFALFHHSVQYYRVYEPQHFEARSLNILPRKSTDAFVDLDVKL